jgi:hypothetical protein
VRTGMEYDTHFYVGTLNQYPNAWIIVGLFYHLSTRHCRYSILTMSKRDLLKLPDDLEANLRALLGTPPPPHDVKGSRKTRPKTTWGGPRKKGQTVAGKKKTTAKER